MLEGIIRDSIEKKATKALRRDGYLIANIYGKGVQNINAAFKANEFIKAAKSKESLIFPVSVAGQVHHVVIQDYQRDPVNNTLLHVDLRLALPGVMTKYLVPVVLEGTPKGTKNKGVLIQSKKRLAVKCTAENLPNCFTINVDHLDVGDTVLVREIVVPENVKMVDEARVSVAGVIKAK